MRRNIAKLFITLSMVAVMSACNANDNKVTDNKQLTQAEIEGLQYMLEEEKLAHDVYLYFYEKYNLNAFGNIMKSEQQHMKAIQNILDNYGIDKINLQENGKFINPSLQNLYNELIAKGTTLKQALYVGISIEELDIKDLQEYKAKTNNELLIKVYSNLISASENHLRAFNRNLSFL